MAPVKIATAIEQGDIVLVEVLLAIPKGWSLHGCHSFERSQPGLSTGQHFWSALAQVKHFRSSTVPAGAFVPDLRKTVILWCMYASGQPVFGFGS